MKNKSSYNVVNLTNLFVKAVLKKHILVSSWKKTFWGGLYQEAVLGVIVHIFVCFLMNV